MSWLPETWKVRQGDCLMLLPSLPAQSVDAGVFDPPYPEIRRPYGRLTEAEWHDLMDRVIEEFRRILKPKGSVCILLQPNFDTIGKMRLWLWEFALRTAKKWNWVQDAYAWNNTAIPGAGTRATEGLMRSSLKYSLWFGDPACFRDQDAVLLPPCKDLMRPRCRKYITPAGHYINDHTLKETAKRRGGTTPFNVLPLGGNTRNTEKHPARSSYRWAEFWVKYICPPSGIVVDPFAGCGTIGLAAITNGRRYLGFERNADYCGLAEERLDSLLDE